MTVTWYEQGLKKGKLDTILAILENRFGQLPLELRQRLESCPDERIPALIQRVAKAGAIEDLADFDLEA